MRSALERIVEPPIGWVSGLGGVLQPAFSALFRHLRLIRNFLNGTWLGHPLHPALTDLPIGAFVVGFVLDVANQRAAADVAIVIGVLGMLAAAVSGVADYADTYGRPRDVGTLHALTMVVALVLYLISIALRAGNPADRTVPVVIGTIGLLLVLAGAYLGGDLVFALGNMVDRHAWDEEEGGEWQRLDVAEVTEATPVRAMAGADPLLLVRTGTAIHALHDVCAHAGGPLHEGRIVDGCIECPWHASRFRLTDGHLVSGPSVYDQPRYEVRETTAGRFEARRVP